MTEEVTKDAENAPILATLAAQRPQNDDQMMVKPEVGHTGECFEIKDEESNAVSAQPAHKAQEDLELDIEP